MRMSASDFKKSGITQGKGGRFYLPNPAECKTNKFHNNTGWFVDGIHNPPPYMHSQMESNYARYLNFLVTCGQIKSWEYEPDKLRFGNDPKDEVSTHTPDFKVWLNDESFEYHEVKGMVKPSDKRKIKKMKRYYPGIIYKMVGCQGKDTDDKTAFKFDINFYEIAKLRHIIPGWDIKLLSEKPVGVVK